MDGGLPLGFQNATLFHCQNLLSYPYFWWILADYCQFWLFFANFCQTHTCFRNICGERDPSLENLGVENPPICAAHTRTYNILCNSRDLNLKLYLGSFISLHWASNPMIKIIPTLSLLSFPKHERYSVKLIAYSTARTREAGQYQSNFMNNFW